VLVKNNEPYFFLAKEMATTRVMMPKVTRLKQFASSILQTCKAYKVQDLDFIQLKIAELD
jgi:hypothetical protein